MENNRPGGLVLGWEGWAERRLEHFSVSAEISLTSPRKERNENVSLTQHTTCTESDSSHKLSHVHLISLLQKWHYFYPFHSEKNRGLGRTSVLEE